ncbi:MAG: sensor histidine kinase [Bryobacteraceae bacterium]
MTLFTPPFNWNLYLSIARVLLGVAALVTDIGGRDEIAFFPVAMGVFLAYAVLVALRRRRPSGPFGLLALFGDTVFFLILAAHGSGHSAWFPSVFFLYLLTEALVFYGPREVVVVAGISTLFCAVAPGREMAILERVVLVTGVMAVAFSVSRERQRRRIEELASELDKTREAAYHAAEQERQRIASDFHDGALQSFISLQMRLEILRKVFERDHSAGMEELQQLQALALSQVRELRAFVRSMRPVDADSGNIFATGRRLAEHFYKESGIPVTFVGGDKPLGLSQEISSEVMQMLREALHNVQKHSGATRVAVTMEKKDHILELSVDDNGRGFHFSGTYNLDELELLKLGPASLKRRARSLNAEVTLESRPGRGAGLKFRIPVQ